MSDTVGNDVSTVQHEICSCPKHVNLLTTGLMVPFSVQ